MTPLESFVNVQTEKDGLQILHWKPPRKITIRTQMAICKSAKKEKDFMNEILDMPNLENITKLKKIVFSNTCES